MAKIAPKRLACITLFWNGIFLGVAFFWGRILLASDDLAYLLPSCNPSFLVPMLVATMQLFLRHPKPNNELYLETDFPERSRISGC